MKKTKLPNVRAEIKLFSQITIQNINIQKGNLMYYLACCAYSRRRHRRTQILERKSVHLLVAFFAP